MKNLYYISKGIVREKNGPIEDHEAPKIKNKAGDILGLQFVTSNEGLSFTNCYAKTVCTCRVFPIAELLSFITTYEQERMLWLYIGPSIIYLNPNMFNKLQGLDPIQLKALLKESTYRQISKGEKFYLQNGGVLFEGQVEESFTSKSETDLRASDEDENVYQDVRKAVIKNYAFIYPNSSRYTARTICRIFEFPESLREKWLAFNIRIFQEAIKGLPSMIGGNASQTIKEQSTIDRRQRTLLMGLPKGLANADSIKSITQNKARENIYKIDIQNLNYNDEGATIIPKGYTKKVSRLPPVSTSPTEDEKNVKAQEENNQKTITKLDTRTLPITMKPNEDDSSKDDDEENSSEADENESEDEDSSNIISNSNVLAQVSSSDERIQDEEEEESSN